MAEKRMFSKKIIDTDCFMEMPATTQNLYFHLSMRADDDGFVASPKRIIRLVGASEDDFRLLVLKHYIIPFESGVCVITDWRINNYLRSDRYSETTYKDEKRQLTLDENGKYQVGIPDGIPQGIPVVSTDIFLPNSNTNTKTLNNNNSKVDNNVESNIDKKTSTKENKLLSIVREFFTDEEVILEIGMWLKHKQEKGQTYKPTGLTNLLQRLKRELETNGKQFVIDEIKYSIGNNYSGIYPAKEQKSKSETVAPSQFTEDDLKRYRRED